MEERSARLARRLGEEGRDEAGRADGARTRDEGSARGEAGSPGDSLTCSRNRHSCVLTVAGSQCNLLPGGKEGTDQGARGRRSQTSTVRLRFETSIYTHVLQAHRDSAKA